MTRHHPDDIARIRALAEELDDPNGTELISLTAGQRLVALGARYPNHDAVYGDDEGLAALEDFAYLLDIYREVAP